MIYTFTERIKVMIRINRQVNILNIGVSGKNQNISALLSLIEQESKEGVDLILLPEMCLGFSIIGMSDEAVVKMCKTAGRKGVYIILTVFRYGDNKETYNTSILIDRNGNIAGLYDKVYPFWGEGFLSIISDNLDY